jgi:hypothetical protein
MLVELELNAGDGLHRRPFLRGSKQIGHPLHQKGRPGRRAERQVTFGLFLFSI